MRSFIDNFFASPDALPGMRPVGRTMAVAAEPAPTGLLVRGQRGPDVVRLQQLLNRQTNPAAHLTADGDFGPATERAVRRFQEARHLPVDGQVGRQTWQALLASVGTLTDVVHQAPAAPASAQRQRPAPGATSSPPASTSEPAWMAVARGEIGQEEVSGARAHNPRIIAYHATTGLRAQTDEIAWCASFVNWVMLQTGIEGTGSAGAASWLRWGQPCEAQLGAIVVIRNQAAAGSSLTTTGNHVGFLLEETATHYVVLGGNQSDMVRRSQFPRSRWTLRGYRWPTGH